MAVAAAGGKFFKGCAIVGVAGSLLFGTAYTISTAKSVAPKTGEGVGVGVGGGLLLLQNVPKGVQEMLGQQAVPVPPVPPAVVPPAAKG